MVRPLLPALLGVLALALVACASPGEQQAGLGRPEMPLPAPSAPDFALKRGALAPEEGSALPSVDERLIIRNGQISLVVADVDAAMQGATSLAQELGGFVLSSSRSGEKETAFAQITIRVPADRFDLALERLRRLGQRVEAESTSSQDVTEEFVDLQARLRNLQATERQLIALLDRAETVEDVLKVQRELSNVRGEIERFQGRIQYLERSAAYSLITLSLRPATNPAPIVNPRWSLLETVREAARSLVESFQGAATLAIWVGVFAPLWLPLLLGAWVLWRWWRRARRASRAAAGAA